MAGIYIHIPFCKQACYYCDFHFSTSLKQKDLMIDAICREIELKKLFFNSTEKIKTIYFGGGTPSLLNYFEFDKIFKSLQKNFLIEDPEITLEANPDDITEQKLDDWKKLGFNRLSIGIQSFHDKALKFMNRCHNSNEAHKSIKMAQAKGFDNISLDLIFGIQNLTQEEFELDLRSFIKLKPNHISAYCLTIEEGTVFGNQLEKGIIKDVSEESSSKQFLQISDELTEAGYKHYEISNYELENHESKHNTSYWEGKKYLGLGPSAHSFDGNKRFFNNSNNSKYIEAITNNGPYYDFEELTLENQINEYILTKLRTLKGIDIDAFKLSFGIKQTQELISKARKITLKDFLDVNSKNIYLTRKGKLLADSVCGSLFCDI